MFKILMTTLICTFLGSLFSFILFISKPGNADNAVYATILVFGSIIGPIFIAAFLFRLIKKHVKSKSVLLLTLLKMGSLLALLIVGVFVWVLTDVVVSNFSWQSMKADYKSQFAGFMAIGIFIALSMPLVDLGLDKLLQSGRNGQSS